MGTWNGWFPASAVSVEGETRQYAFGGLDAPGDVACFCPICGKGGFSRLSQFLPDCLIIAMGSFASPDASPIPPPRMVHFWENRPDWLDSIADLPKGMSDDPE